MENNKVKIRVYSKINKGTRWFDDSNACDNFIAIYECQSLADDPRYSDLTWADIVPHPIVLAAVESYHPGCVFVYNDAGMTREGLRKLV